MSNRAPKHILVRTSDVIVAPSFFILDKVTVLMPAQRASSFAFMPLSISNLKSFLYEIIIVYWGEGESPPHSFLNRYSNGVSLLRRWNVYINNPSPRQLLSFLARSLPRCYKLKLHIVSLGKSFSLFHYTGVSPGVLLSQSSLMSISMMSMPSST